MFCPNNKVEEGEEDNHIAKLQSLIEDEVSRSVQCEENNASYKEPDVESGEDTEDRQPAAKNNYDDGDVEITEGSIAEEIATEDNNDYSNSD